LFHYPTFKVGIAKGKCERFRRVTLKLEPPREIIFKGQLAALLWENISKGGKEKSKILKINEMKKISLHVFC